MYALFKYQKTGGKCKLNENEGNCNGNAFRILELYLPNIRARVQTLICVLAPCVGMLALFVLLLATAGASSIPFALYLFPIVCILIPVAVVPGKSVRSFATNVCAFAAITAMLFLIAVVFAANVWSLFPLVWLFAAFVWEFAQNFTYEGTFANIRIQFSGLPYKKDRSQPNQIQGFCLSLATVLSFQLPGAAFSKAFQKPIPNLK